MEIYVENKEFESEDYTVGVDFKSAYNFELDPSANQINKAKFSAANISGLLTQYNITIE